jgi:hypothetical protein
MYANYYFCVTERAWLLTRTRSPTADILDAGHAAAAANNLNEAWEDVDQVNCPLVP